MFYDMLEIKNSETKAKIYSRITELEKQLEEAEKSLRLNELELINDELQNVKNELIYLNKNSNDFDIGSVQFLLATYINIKPIEFDLKIELCKLQEKIFLSGFIEFDRFKYFLGIN